MNPGLLAYGRVLQASWRWIAWGVIAAVAATAVVLIVWPPLYRTEARVFVRTPGDVSMASDGGDLYAQTRAETYAALARGPGIASRVIADLGLDISPQTLTRRVTARHVSRTALVEIRVAAPSRDEARRAAEVLLNELASDVKTLEAVPGSVAPRAELVVVDPPTQTTRVIARGAPLYPVMIGAIIFGALIAALAAVIRALRAQVGRHSAGGRHELVEKSREGL